MTLLVMPGTVLAVAVLIVAEWREAKEKRDIKKVIAELHARARYN